MFSICSLLDVKLRRCILMCVTSLSRIQSNVSQRATLSCFTSSLQSVCYGDNQASQSLSGGVIVNPYIGNFCATIAISHERKKKTRGFKSLHWVAFLNIWRTLDFRIHLSNLIKKGLHGSAFSFSIYQVKK